MKPTPPFMQGLPVLGNLLGFLKNSEQVMKRGYEQYGDIFAIKLANQNVAILVGPEYSAQIFERTDKELSIREAFQFLEPITGPVGVLASPEAYQQERKIVGPILGGRYMSGHIQAMVRETRDWITTLGDEGAFDLNDFAQHITLCIAARALLGEEFRANLGSQFVDLFHDLAKAVTVFLPPNLPLPSLIKCRRARKTLNEMLDTLIAQRRANPEQYDDFLQGLVMAKLDNGETFSDERLMNLVCLLIFAGFDTTSAHLAWGLIYLLQYPDYFERVRGEIDEVFAQTRALELKHLRQMPRLNYALMEVERHHSVASVVMRHVREAFDIGGYHIPAGWRVMLGVRCSHHLPRIFTEPDQFDPERFNPERCEHAQHPHALIGFGGGTHKCWGMKFAYYEMAIIIAMLLHEYELTIADPSLPEKKIGGIPRPMTDIHYRRRAVK